MRGTTLLRIAITAWFLVVGLAGCGRDDGSPAAAGPSTPSASGQRDGYVGLAACAECHPAETAVWRGSHHDLAMQPATDATVLGDFDDAVFEHGGVNSRFFRTDGRFFVHTEGPGGALGDFEIKWTFGADPLQQYLVGFPDGRLQALGIAWDTRPAEAGGQRWFHVYGDEIIPWDDELHWTKPAQNWNYMCADCHSTGYRKNYDPESDTFAPAWSDVNVACEACHGPGAEHAARVMEGRLDQGTGLEVPLSTPGRTRRLDEGATTLSIVGGEGPAAEVEACGRCHARRAPISAAYRHGRPVLDSYLPELLTEPLYFPDGQIRDEVFVYGSFRQSRMYAAGVGCNDCHDPHSLELRAEGDGVCAQCHLPGHYASPTHTRHEPAADGPGCRDCHMPARTYMVVDPRRDHSFRVPRADLAASLGVTDACDACHADRPDGWSAGAVRGWLGRDAAGLQQFAEVFAAAGAGQIEVGEGLRRIADDPAEPGIVRGTALALLAGYAGEATLRVAAAALQDRDPAVRLAALGPLASVPVMGRAELLRPLLSDPVLAVRIEAARLLAGLDARVLDDRGRAELASALEEYVDAQRASLDRAAAWVNLGNLYAEAGQSAVAESQYRAALARDDGFVPAYVNLVDLLTATGDVSAAGEVLSAALARRPDDASVHHVLGLHQVRTGERREALASLEKAVELAPTNTRFRYVYAIALKDQGRMADAIAELERAYRDRPANAEVLWALATTLAESGDAAAAAHYAELLARLVPDNPRVREFLDRLPQD